MKMKIIIPSLGRAGRCNSMKWLAATSREIWFAVHGDEVKEYKTAYPNCEVIGLSDASRHHTGLVRQEILETLPDPFIFVDDDIRISMKTVTHVDEIFNLLESHIRAGFSMAGLAPQLYSNFADPITINGDPCAIRNKFVATVYAIDPAVFASCPLELLPVYEDIALVIHAIQHGGGTIVTYQATHSNVSPDVGGCNAWRNKEITLNSLDTLVSLYPDICSIRETRNTTHSQNIGVGLRTAWAKIHKLEN